MCMCVCRSSVQACAELYQYKGICKGMSKGVCVCVCVCVCLSPRPTAHMGVGLSHVPLVLST